MVFLPSKPSGVSQSFRAGSPAKASQCRRRRDADHSALGAEFGLVAAGLLQRPESPVVNKKLCIDTVYIMWLYYIYIYIYVILWLWLYNIMYIYKWYYVYIYMYIYIYIYVFETGVEVFKMNICTTYTYGCRIGRIWSWTDHVVEVCLTPVDSILNFNFGDWYNMFREMTPQDGSNIFGLLLDVLHSPRFP